MSDFYELECPHCKGILIVMKNEINCCIFRHGIYKHDNTQLPPHSSKEVCDEFFKQGNYGCGKPFRLCLENEKVRIEICDYI
jgi:hypothetical protein